MIVCALFSGGLGSRAIGHGAVGTMALRAIALELTRSVVRAIPVEFEMLLVMLEAFAFLHFQGAIGLDGLTLLGSHVLQLFAAGLALCHILLDEGFNLGALLRSQLSHGLLGSLIMTLLALLQPFFMSLLALLGSHFFPFGTAFFHFCAALRAHSFAIPVMLEMLMLGVGALGTCRAVGAVFAQDAVHTLTHGGLLSIVISSSEGACAHSS